MDTKRISFEPKVWGPHAWNFIHFVALSYPKNPMPKDKATYKQFYFLLGNVLPCTSCVKNYRRHWHNYPIDQYLSSPDALFEWTVIIRNAVKQQIHNNDQIYYNPTELREQLLKNEQKNVGLPYLLPIAIILGGGAIPFLLFYCRS